MPQPLLVTLAIIKKDGKFLITQRPQDGRHKAGFWEFPGGKIEFGETPRECVEREIFEELGIRIKAREVVEVVSHLYDADKQVILLGFYCDYLDGEIQTLDIINYAWVMPDALNKYKFCEADLVFVDKLKK